MGKKGVSKIAGNTSPVVGKKQIYTVVGWYFDTPPSNRNAADVTWELFKKRSTGKFTTTHITKKGIGEFTFGEKAVGQTYMLEGYLYEPEGKGLIITPQPAEIPKINKVELFYVDNTPGKTFSFMEKLRAKAYCVNMLMNELIFTLWEDDATGEGHNQNNKPIATQKGRVDKDGVAVTEFMLTQALMKKAMEGETDPKQLEFYVTVEFFRDRKHATDNVNLNNPFPQPQRPQARPANIPKAKDSPAESKPPSKKEEKGILERLEDWWDSFELWDWGESKGTVKKDQEPTVQRPEGRSPSVVGKSEMEKKEEKIDETCGISYRDQILCVKFGKKNPKYGPVFWGSLKLANYSQWSILLSNNKITLEEKDIIIGMSENEGKLDSVQSYDSEIITVGAMQKTVNPEGYGEFPIQMQEFKEEYPERFKKLFENCGWTVKKETIKVGKKEDIKWRAYYLDTTGKDLKNKIREGFNEKVYKKKVKCIPIEPLINAAKDPYFQAKQVEDFILRLKNKVLPIKPTGYEHTIKDYLKSKLGKATALDQHINRPAYVKDDFGKALDHFFKENTKVSKNPNDWGNLHKEYEREILEYYGKNRRGTQMSIRYSKMKASPYLK